MRRTLTLAAALIAVAATGCGHCGTKAGFTLAYHLPPTVSQSAIVGPQVTQYSAQGLACGPTAGQLGLYSADAPPIAMRTVERVPMVERAPVRAPVSECSLEEICRMLERISRRLDQLPNGGAQRMPMPKTKDDGSE